MGYGDEAARAWWDKGREFMERGDWPSATHAFRTAVSIDPEFGEAYAGLGAALGNQLLWSLAVEAHTRAAVLLPDDLDTAYNLGVAYGEPERAKRKSAFVAYLRCGHVMQRRCCGWVWNSPCRTGLPKRRRY
jgi:tetratricopeptide (TPR) repeat protein